MALSARGRFAVFHSSASNLVPGDGNGRLDIFLRDRRSGTTRRLSIGPGGRGGDGDSTAPSVSARGRFVAFASGASNLVAGDGNDAYDVFVRDRRTGTTTRVSVSSGGAQANASSFEPSISADGRFVAFDSSASNLVAGDGNGVGDVFLRDRRTGATRRLSVSSRGASANAPSYSAVISASGRFVAFTSTASNLVRGDTNGHADVFVRDRRTGTTRRVSVSSAGRQANGGSAFADLSADGRFVAFRSSASNLVPGDTNGLPDVFVRDRTTGKTRRVSVSSTGAQANGGSDHPALSADGRLVAFDSGASNLVRNDSNGQRDVFVRNRRTGETRRVSVSSSRAQAAGASEHAALSADGRFVGFHSEAANLVGGDGNGVRDVFVRGPLR